MQKYLDTARRLFKSYILTPETLAPGVITVAVLGGGVIVTAHGPNASIVRLLGAVALSLGSVGVGLLIAHHQVRVLTYRMELAENIADIRTEVCDQFQATITELKNRINRLYRARQVRVENTGPTRVFGTGYRKTERALP